MQRFKANKHTLSPLSKGQNNYRCHLVKNLHKEFGFQGFTFKDKLIINPTTKAGL